MRDRYVVQHSDNEEDKWIVTDTDNGIVCTFTQHQWNDSQKYTYLDDRFQKDPSLAQTLAKLMREMADFMFNNYYTLVFPYTKEVSMVTWAKRIKYIREQKGWTRYRLAKTSGISEQTVTNIETGRTIPSIYILEQLLLSMNCAIKVDF